jgi:heterodisulfide reductase subunit B2
MKIGYYPGCSLLGSSKEFDESVRAVAQALDLELVEVPDWNCCGASSAHVLDPTLSLALPNRILAQAEAAGLTEVLAPCAACYNRLATAREAVAKDETLARNVEEALGRPVAKSVRVVNILELLDRFKDVLPGKATARFPHKAACYYGCLLVRPPKVLNFDRAEDPQSMDRLVAAIGGEPLPWAFKTECCGAAFSVTRTDLVARMSGKIVESATKAGAEVIVVACPMCHSNLDMRRPEIDARLGEAHRIPVMFITQAIGLALGIDANRLGLQRHMVPVQLAPATV